MQLKGARYFSYSGFQRLVHDIATIHRGVLFIVPGWRPLSSGTLSDVDLGQDGLGRWSVGCVQLRNQRKKSSGWRERFCPHRVCPPLLSVEQCDHRRVDIAGHSRQQITPGEPSTVF